MARAIAFAQLASTRFEDVARATIVTACAVALIAAGQALPF